MCANSQGFALTESGAVVYRQLRILEQQKHSPLFTVAQGPRRPSSSRLLFGAVLVAAVLALPCANASASTVATPTFSPVAGTYTSAQTVTISDTTSGATIYYTTNGSAPTTSSTKYTAPIAVSASETVKAIGTKSGYTQSSVGSATYTITLTAATPTFSPAAGTYTSVQSVTISDSTSGATIYYTTNGSTPTTSSTKYSTPISVSSTETVKAIATATGYSQSGVGSAVYTITLTAATPTFSPGGGSYSSSQTVTINDATSGATIYYTTNGSTPTTRSSVYSTPIAVSATETIKAIAAESGYSQSAVGSATYTITLTAATPALSPPGGSYSSAFPLSITDSTSGATIYYTTDGSTPTTSSAVYSGAITVTASETVKAIAADSGYAQSSIATGTYTLPAQAATTVSLSVTTNGTQTSSVTAGAVVTLTANVTAAASPVAVGTVVFCYQVSTACADTAPIGSAQVNSSGVAVIKWRPTLGNHSILAEYIGNASFGASTSVASRLAVEGKTITTLSATPTGQTYTLAATVSGEGSASYSPSGTASFTDATEGGAVVATAPLTPGATLAGFTATASLGTGGAPNDIAVADLNGDGNPDIVVPNGFDNTLTILLGNGDGTFNALPALPVSCSQPGPIAIGDFNGDGIPDIAVLCGGTATALILLGNGDGTFRPAPGTPPSSTYFAESIAVGDFNHDGKLDLAIGGEWVSIWLGNGDGTFTEAQGSPIDTTSGDSEAWSIRVADFNGDGNPDLAVAYNGSSTVAILLGNGDGTFNLGPNSPIKVTGGAASSVVGDFDGNGTADVAVLGSDYEYGVGAVSVFLGDGHGNIAETSQSPILAGNVPYSITSADYNRDGNLDLILAGNGDNAIELLPGNGDGTFGNAAEVESSAPYWVGSADFGGFTGADLATVSVANDSVSVFLNQLQTSATGTAYGVAVVGNGNHNVAAEFPGDSNYAGSVSSTVSVNTVVDTVLGVSPSAGAAGSGITITGVGFGNTQGSGSVAIGGIPAVVTSWAATAIQAVVPNGPGPGPQQVVVSIGGQSGPGAAFTVIPSISTLTPTSGIAGSFVQIAGTNFGTLVSGSSLVTFNGIQAQVTNWTPSGLGVMAPAGVSTGSVVVTACNSAGTWCGASNPVTFTVPTSPVISGISPVSGPIGASVSISGVNFGTTAGTVTFNGVAANPTSWGSQTIVAPVPSGATSGPVVVTSGGNSSNSYAFTVSGGISTISPTQGVAGTTVTITGIGFGNSQGSSVVSIGGMPVTPASWSNTSIVAAAPAGGTTGSVTVLIAGETSTGPIFTYLPQIAALSPSSAPTGTVVSISGSNFGPSQGTSSVYFGQAVGFPSRWSAGSIAVSVPVNAVTGTVTVVVGGEASNAVPFTIGAATSTGTLSGTITQSDGVTPISGATVTLLNGETPVGSAATTSSGTYTLLNLGTGTYSVEASAYGFGAAQTSVSVTLGQTTVANLSLSSQSEVSYSYDADGRLVGVSTSQGAAGYAYDPVGNILSIARSGAGQTAVLSFSPTWGTAGTVVTIFGAGFSPNPQQDTVTVGGSAANISSSSATQIMAVVPAGATSGPIGVTSPDGSATSGNSFIVGAPPGAPSITSFTPAMAGPGGTVTISGSGFDVLSNDEVSFNGPAAQLTSVSPTTIVATVPTSAASGPISITTPAGSASSSSSLFVVPAGYTTAQVDFTGQLAIGSPYTGTIQNSGDIGLLVFTATAGQPISLSISDSTITEANISVIAPGGSTLDSESVGTGSSLLDSIPAPTSGTYSVIVTGSPSGFTGNVTLNLAQSTSQQTTVGNTTTAQVNIETSGQTAEIPFTGTAGQVVSVELENSTFDGGCYNVQVSILNPDGSTLSRGSTCYGGNFLFGPATLPTTGTYTVLISAAGNTGTATVLISLFQNQTIVLTPVSGGTSTSPVSISIPGQQALLSFSGTAGQTVSAELQNSTFGGGCYNVGVSILNPDGSTLTSGSTCGPGTFMFGPSVLPTTGTYTVVVNPGINSGTTTVQVSLFANETGTINPGTPQNVTLAIPGQAAMLTFSGTASQSVNVSLTNVTITGGCYNAAVSILNPDGSTLLHGSTCDQYDIYFGPATLPSTGSYTLVIAPSSGSTGSATVLVTLQ